MLPTPTLVNYHFGKRLDLFQAVFKCRAELLSTTRQEVILANQEKAGDQPQTLLQVIEAFELL
jgi:AcrR family transcriptional regulator